MENIRYQAAKDVEKETLSLYRSLDGLLCLPGGLGTGQGGKR